jgi:hypothetical protein
VGGGGVAHESHVRAILFTAGVLDIILWERETSFESRGNIVFHALINPYLNSVNQLIFVMVKCGVLFEVRTEFLNNI